MHAFGQRVVRSVSLAMVLGGLPVAFAAAPADAAVTDRYVDKTMSSCSDTGPGTATAPYCTITKGVSALQAGDTLYIGDGVYNETVKPSVSGTSTAPVTITRWAGKSPTIGVRMTNGVNLSSRSFVTVSGLTIANTVADGIYVSGSNNVTVSANTVTGAGAPASGQTAPGISLRGTSSSRVSGNTTDQNHGHGILLTSSSSGNTVSGNEASLNAEGWRRNANGIDVISPGNTIIGNITHDNEDSGINFYSGGNNNLAVNNVTYNNGDHGIDDYNVTGGRLIGNTVFHNCTSGINVEGTSGSYTVMNNVAVDNAVYPAYNGISCSRRAGNIGIWDSAPASTHVDHNLVWLSKSGTMYVFGSSFTTLAAMQAATGQEKAGVQGDPRFVDPAHGNLRLSAGSPAIDRADSGTSGAQAADILGNPRVDDPSTPNTYASGPRPFDDLGAYEFQPSSTPAPSAPTAVLSVSPSSGTAPVAVTADASGSSDPQGQTLSYVFDFGDGTSVGPQAGATASHTYSTSGSFTVRVTVTDTSGLSSSATRTVTVSAPTVSAPTAALSVSPSSGTAPVAVTADASGSSDPQGQTLSYVFDFGDGTSVGPQAGATASHTYSTSGSFTVRVTVTDTSGLSSSATRTVTVSAPTVSAPTAALSVSPSSGTAPVAVTADASGSSDPQGQTLSYVFDFGDGTSVGPQAGATASHTYSTSGSFTVRVTVTDTSGLSSSVTRTVTVSSGVPQAAPAYVNQIATNYSTSSKTSGYITVWRTAGVQAGDLVVLSLQLTGTAATGAVFASDTAGNSYTVAEDVADGAGDRLVVLAGVAATALPSGGKITVTFPTASTGYRLLGDEFTGVTTVDATAAATGPASAFSSGAATTSASEEVVFGAVIAVGAGGAPSWASGWKDLGTYAVGTTYLGRASQLPTTTGSFAASGTTSGSWLAATVTFKP